MNNIKCTIGYERREGRLLVVELLDAELKPQDIVAGLESGKYMLMGNAIIESPEGLYEGGRCVANRVGGSTLESLRRSVSKPENFILESAYCDNCGMPLEQKSIDGGRCIECTAMRPPGVGLLPTYSDKFEGHCPDPGCPGICEVGDCSHCGDDWQENVKIQSKETPK
jgi:hypothetical protein